ncbi:MAG: chemotaxis protein CheA [Firmicutes bacterium]|nr:chemotaxis protein CheA [Bacillota bacterium]
MSDQYSTEPLLEMYLFETSQLLEQLEQSILSSEKESGYTEDAINEIFRIMHTIKGSSAMMLFDNIAKLAHSIEDLFFYIRKEKPEKMDLSALSDLVLEGVDFIKTEVDKIKGKSPADGNAEDLVTTSKTLLAELKQMNAVPDISLITPAPVAKSTAQTTAEDILETQHYYISQANTPVSNGTFAYKAVVHFEEGCEMENIRAYTIIHNLKETAGDLYYLPADIIDSDESVNIIRKDGFQIFITTDWDYRKMHDFLMQTIFLKDMELTSLENTSVLDQFKKKDTELVEKPIKMPTGKEVNVVEKSSRIPLQEKEALPTNTTQSIISVSVVKLDKLMDLVGEMVIAEAMVIQNPDLKGLQLSNFSKAANQLNKITSEIQDIVMSIRMVPLSATFIKMHRIVRDMCKKLDKDVQLEIIGEETEVDKNIIEHISDPLMHLVRNSVDHGIETTEERLEKGKPKSGTITLEAKNAGSDVLIIVRDDGKGLNKEKILKKAKENNLLFKNEEDMTDKEIYNLILLPGFSTKEKVTEFSGRGVGMDVVTKNIEAVGGTLSVDSVADKGTVITLKIPLTLAIIDGMNIKVGKSRYTIPTISIKESFRPKESEIIHDPDGNEMIMVRGECYAIRRLHDVYRVATNITRLSEGIIIMVEQDEKTVCVFADELLGQQQVVVKALPQYIQNFKKIRGLAGCTLLGDGSISLILDVARMFNH